LNWAAGRAIGQECTTRWPDPAPEHVLSGPRIRLKVQETSPE